MTDTPPQGLDPAPIDTTTTTAPGAAEVDPKILRRAWNQLRSTSIPVLFLLVSLPVGLTFVLMIPPGQGRDEPAHFLRAWKIADGDFRSSRRFDPALDSIRPGGQFDLCVLEYLEQFRKDATLPAAFSWHSFWFDTPPCEPARREFRFADAAADYSPIGYFPQASVLAVSRALGLPLPVAFFAGRLASLLAFIASVYVAMRVAGRALAAMFLIALLPMSLMAAAVYSADAVLLAMTLLAVALVIRLWTPSVNPPQALLALILLLLFIGVAKPAYVPISGLILLVPASRFPTRRLAVAAYVGVPATALLLVALWARFGAPPPTDVFDEAGTIDRARQTAWILQHPLAYASVIGQTLLGWEFATFSLRGWVGSFGMFRTGRQQDSESALYAVLAAGGGITAAYLREAGVRLRLTRAHNALAIMIPLLVTAVTLLALLTSAYVQWNAVAASQISGLQGRYFLPLLVIPVLVLALRRGSRHEYTTNLWFALLSLSLLLYAVDKSLDLYY